MDYYRCSIEDLQHEITRRGYKPEGTCDQLSESLQKHDDTEGTDATTIRTQPLELFEPSELNHARPAEISSTVPATALVKENIIFWSMNTFFPTLQLFFESGLSCTIDGGRLPNAEVGLDPDLRFRLTDCTHEEQGRIVKTPLPDRFAQPGATLAILDLVIAQRTSIAVKPVLREERAHQMGPCSSAYSPSTSIVEESHIVVGLQLQGMSKMAYIWSKNRSPFETGNATWGDVHISGLRNDVPSPLLGYLGRPLKPGDEATVVIQNSMIRQHTSKDQSRNLEKPS